MLHSVFSLINLINHILTNPSTYNFLNSLAAHIKMMEQVFYIINGLICPRVGVKVV